MHLYIGTYTSLEGHSAIPATASSQGIYRAEWDAQKGQLSEPELAARTPNPTFLARSNAGGPRLYATVEVSDYKGMAHMGGIAPFTAHPDAAASAASLTALPTVSSGGDGPTHIAVDATGRAVFVANYGGGSLSTFRVTRQGLSAPASVHAFHGHGPNAARQEASHVHCVTVSPGNHYVLVSDLGLDRILIFSFDPDTALVTPSSTEPYWSATPGSGPRHTRFHPNGRWLYSVNELNSTVDCLDWDEAQGRLTHASTAKLLPADFPVSQNTAAELVIDRPGRFLYATNRGHNSVAVFSIDAGSGALSLVERVPCGGKHPRHFAMDPSDKWLLVANRDTNNIAIFARDPSTGKLRGSGSMSAPAPVCILFD